jgi:hypothetical protein
MKKGLCGMNRIAYCGLVSVAEQLQREINAAERMEPTSRTLLGMLGYSLAGHGWTVVCRHRGAAATEIVLTEAEKFVGTVRLSSFECEELEKRAGERDFSAAVFPHLRVKNDEKSAKNDEKHAENLENSEKSAKNDPKAVKNDENGECGASASIPDQIIERAHAELDAMGVPPSGQIVAGLPAGGSLLVQRLRVVKKKHQGLRDALAEVSGELRRAQAEVAMHRQKAAGEYWIWQGDGGNYEHTSAPVLIGAAEFQAILRCARLPAHPAPRVVCARSYDEAIRLGARRGDVVVVAAEFKS